LKLVLVGTPLGNLGDLSERAARILSEADLVVCEDTRVALRLLSALGIKGKRLVSWGAYDEHRKLERVMSEVRSARLAAYLVDAGMPGIADPGSVLVRRARQEGIEVSVVPGPSAAVAALALSGFAADEFHFAGFLPRSSSKRRKKLDHLTSLGCPVVIYESPHRVRRLLEELSSVSPGREVFIAKELTKAHESFAEGRPDELLGWPGVNPPRGEYVAVLGPSSS
jgi:16S rRNA (cytidine1402-2'-O)-methyltransferase